MHQCVADPDLPAFLDCLWDEAAPTLGPTPGLNLACYRRDLRKRFGNAALCHRTRQIAMDGSQKLPQRLLSSIRDRLDAGLPFPALSLGVAAWMRWQLGIDEAGQSYRINDPLASRLNALARDAGGKPAQIVRNLTGLSDIFDADLPSDPRFLTGIEAALAKLLTQGVRKTIQSLVAKSNS